MRARESNFNRPLVYPKIRNFVFVQTCEMRPDFVLSEASRGALVRSVRNLQDSEFFFRNGLLFLPGTKTGHRDRPNC